MSVKAKLDRICINEAMLVKDALKQMDREGQKTLLITGPNRLLLGAITDGDIRRWILGDGSLTAPVASAMTANPLSCPLHVQTDEIRKIMLKTHIECIPLIDESGAVKDAFLWYEIFSTEKPAEQFKIPVVIMAGGMGTRLHPFTKILPKPLIPINEKAIIEIIIEKFTRHGCRDFFLSVNYKAAMIRAYFNDIAHDYSIEYVHEEQPLGTAGSLALLSDKLNGSFFVSNCDIIIEADYADILKRHREDKNIITVISSLKHYRIPYGIMQMAEGGRLEGISEKPEYDFFVNTGMYLLEKDALGLLPAGKPFLMTDLINDCLAKKMRVGIYPVSDASWIDVGQWEELQNALTRFGIK